MGCKGYSISYLSVCSQDTPITGCEFYERDDFAHVLKVRVSREVNYTLHTISMFHYSNVHIAKSIRLGGPSQLQLDRFTEALYDETSGLTFPALTGQRKQSVRDAETLFSEGVEKFMKRKGYTYEERFVRCIRNWRRTCDERGLSSLQRCKFNYQMLELILDELMRWHHQMFDLSLLEINGVVVL